MRVDSGEAWPRRLCRASSRVPPSHILVAWVCRLAQSRGPLFLSESRRNRAEPITLWTWSKVVRAIADRAGLAQFSTHTLRHLCLTDLARAGWDLHEIAAFAGHRNPETTQQYIHLSGQDLARKLAQGMAQIHARRAESLREAFLKSEEPE